MNEDKNICKICQQEFGWPNSTIEHFMNEHQIVIDLPEDKIQVLQKCKSLNFREVKFVTSQEMFELTDLESIPDITCKICQDFNCLQFQFFRSHMEQKHNLLITNQELDVVEAHYRNLEQIITEELKEAEKKQLESIIEY